MGIRRIDFYVPGMNIDMSELEVKHAICKQGIDFIPSGMIEMVIPTSKLQELKLDKWRGEQGVFRASYFKDNSFRNQFFYFAGLIQNVEVKIGVTETSIRTSLFAWPSHGNKSKVYKKNYKLFQDKASFEIVKDIFEKKAGGIVSDQLLGNNVKRQCEVQYGESDWDFIARILSEDGITYSIQPRVKFQQNLNTTPVEISLILNKKIEDYVPLQTENEIEVLIDQNTETNGAYDFEFNKIQVTTRLEMTSTQTIPGQLDLRLSDSEDVDHEWIEVSQHAKYLTLDLGKEYAQKVRESSKRRQFKFKTKDPSVVGGFKYTLKTDASFVVPEIDASEQITVTETVHEFVRSVLGDCEVEVSVIALPHKNTNYAPPYKPRPQLPGLLYANVVDAEHKPDYAKLAADDKVYTNRLAQVKVRITWPGLLEEGTNYCDVWLRMMTPWAGQNAGFLALPRVGQEVIVSFIHGDANQPVVLGCMYTHAEDSGSMPPWDPEKEPKWVGIGTRTNEGDQFMRMSADHLNPSVEIHSGGYLDVKSEKETNIHALTDMNIESTNNMTTRTTSSKRYFSDEFVEGVIQTQLLSTSINTIGVQQNSIATQSNTVGAQTNIIGNQANTITAQENFIAARLNVIGIEQNLIGAQQNTIGARQNLIGINNTICGANSELNGISAEISALKAEISGMKADMSPLITKAYGAELLTVGASMGLYGVVHNNSATSLTTQGAEVNMSGTTVWC
jgi:type VI secretion system secreted protein VgrG